MAKKHKKQKKRSKTIDLADESSRWGGYGGEQKPSKTAKNNAKNWRQKLKQTIEGMEAWKWRQEVEETKKSWQVLGLVQHAAPRGGGPLPSIRQVEWCL